MSCSKLQPKESICSNVYSFSMLHDESLPDDSLPEEAMHDEEMVDDMFLLRLQRQQDLQNRQIWAPVFVPATCPTAITAAKPQQSQHVGQENDRALQQWIKHHSTSSSRFKPDLIECEDKIQVWAHTGIMLSPRDQSQHGTRQTFVLVTRHWEGCRHLSGLNHVRQVKKQRSRDIRKCCLNDYQHRPGNSVMSSAH